jgi:hypothetical protein
MPLTVMFEALAAVTMSSIIFWDVKSCNRFYLFVCSISYISALQMEAVRSFETSVSFYENKWRHILEDCALALITSITSARF